MRWAIRTLIIGLVMTGMPRAIAPSALTPLSLKAFGTLNSDEAVTVWQHRDLDATGAPGPTGWDPWYSVLGRPNVGDPTASLAWHAAGGPVAEAAPIATLAGDDKNPHVSTLGGSTPGTLSSFTTAVWQHAAGTGSAPGDWDIYYSQLNPGTGAWTPPASLPHVHGDDYDPNVAVASNGNALAVWVHREGINDTSARTMYYSVKTGSTWSTPAAIAASNGQVSLPEVTLTSVSSGGPLGSKAIAVWADVVPMLPTRQMFYSIFDGVSWTAPTQIPTEVPVPIIADVGHAQFVGTNPDPYGAFGRNGVTADGLSMAYVLWGGGPQSLGLASAGVVGAFLDLTTGVWTPMLTPFGARFIGVGGCENPDNAMTTATGDFDGVFDFAGLIEDTFRTGGAFTPESFAWDSELTDLRPSNAGLSPTEMVGVNYGSGAASPFELPPSPDPSSDIIFSIATISPGIDAAWGPSAHLVPGGLPGEDYFPEVSSAFAAQIVQPGLTLEPAFAENPVGTPHTVTATVTVNGVPQNGVTVNFTVTPSGGSTPTPNTGACVTGTSGPGQCQFTYTSFTAGTDTITATAVVEGETLTATATKVWFSEAVQKGRITGGALFEDATARVTYGFELHCDATMLPNNLQINWKDPVTGKQRRFHMPNDGMVSANCSNDPTITPDPPPGDPLANDTHDGLGTGRLDGQPGATASWTLKDAGEPGGSDQGGSDFVHFHVTDQNNQTVLSINGKIKRGNHQFHNK